MPNAKTYLVTLEEFGSELAIRFPSEVVAALDAREGDVITAIQEGSSFLLKKPSQRGQE